MRRKQRERNGDGKVYFYDKVIDMEKDGHAVAEKRLRDKLLMAHGVQIIDCGSDSGTGYDEFYRKAFEDVKDRVKVARSGR